MSCRGFNENFHVSFSLQIIIYNKSIILYLTEKVKVILKKIGKKV